MYFDDYGNATETHDVLVHGYDSINSEFTCSYVIRVLSGTGIPGFSTLISPPEISVNQVAVFRGNAWEILDDFRGEKIFSVKDGSLFIMDQLGPLPEGYTQEAPFSSFVIWDGAKWVTDPIAQKDNDIADAGKVQKSLIDSANQIINSKQWPGKAVLGRLNENEHKSYNFWLDYLDKLAIIDLSNAPDIVWPEQPQ